MASSRTEPFFRRSEGSRSQPRGQTDELKTQKAPTLGCSDRADDRFRGGLGGPILYGQLCGAYTSRNRNRHISVRSRQSASVRQMFIRIQYRLPLSSIVLSG